jgi:hypothetical protein
MKLIWIVGALIIVVKVICMIAWTVALRRREATEPSQRPPAPHRPHSPHSRSTPGR